MWNRWKVARNDPPLALPHPQRQAGATRTAPALHATGRAFLTMAMPKTYQTLESLMAQTEKLGRCLEWTGLLTHAGYPKCPHDGKQALVRRLIYEFSGGVLSDKFKLHMTCDNPLCVNPDHMSRLTVSQSASRTAHASWKGSQAVRVAKIAKKQRANSAKLTLDDVKAMRDSPESGKDLASVYGVHHSLISRIRRGESWRSVEASPWSGLL